MEMEDRPVLNIDRVRSAAKSVFECSPELTPVELYHVGNVLKEVAFSQIVKDVPSEALRNAIRDILESI